MSSVEQHREWKRWQLACLPTEEELQLRRKLQDGGERITVDAIVERHRRNRIIRVHRELCIREMRSESLASLGFDEADYPFWFPLRTYADLPRSVRQRVFEYLPAVSMVWEEDLQRILSVLLANDASSIRDTQLAFSIMDDLEAGLGRHKVLFGRFAVLAWSFGLAEPSTGDESPYPLLAQAGIAGGPDDDVEEKVPNNKHGSSSTAVGRPLKFLSPKLVLQELAHQKAMQEENAAYEEANYRRLQEVSLYRDGVVLLNPAVVGGVNSASFGMGPADRNSLASLARASARMKGYGEEDVSHLIEKQLTTASDAADASSSASHPPQKGAEELAAAAQLALARPTYPFLMASALAKHTQREHIGNTIRLADQFIAMRRDRFNKFEAWGAFRDSVFAGTCRQLRPFIRKAIGEWETQLLEWQRGWEILTTTSDRAAPTTARPGMQDLGEASNTARPLSAATTAATSANATVGIATAKALSVSNKDVVSEVAMSELKYIQKRVGSVEYIGSTTIEMEDVRNLFREVNLKLPYEADNYLPGCDVPITEASYAGTLTFSQCSTLGLLDVPWVMGYEWEDREGQLKAEEEEDDDYSEEDVEGHSPMAVDGIVAHSVNFSNQPPDMMSNLFAMSGHHKMTTRDDADEDRDDEPIVAISGGQAPSGHHPMSALNKVSFLLARRQQKELQNKQPASNILADRVAVTGSTGGGATSARLVASTSTSMALSQSNSPRQDSKSSRRKNDSTKHSIDRRKKESAAAAYVIPPSLQSTLFNTTKQTVLSKESTQQQFTYTVGVQSQTERSSEEDAAARAAEERRRLLHARDVAVTAMSQRIWRPHLVFKPRQFHAFGGCELCSTPNIHRLGIALPNTGASGDVVLCEGCYQEAYSEESNRFIHKMFEWHDIRDLIGLGREGDEQDPPNVSTITVPPMLALEADGATTDPSDAGAIVQ